MTVTPAPLTSPVQFFDTRGNVTEPYSFTEALVAGLAPGGGLFIPTELPHFTVEEIVDLAKLPYH